NEFERDTPQWRAFEKAMQAFVRNRVYKFLRQTANRRELRSIRHLNKEIAERLRRSLRRNLRVLARSLRKAKPSSKRESSLRRASKTRREGGEESRTRKAREREATRSVVRLGDYQLAFDVVHGGNRGQAYVETDKNGVRTIYVNMDHPMWDVESSMTPTKLRYCIRQILERSIAEEFLPASPSTPEEAFSILDSLYNDALS
ncbi:MAG TPA: hypothetical protein VI816_04635, partial [Candidatus Bathyarchaeia archaeon]|nr:hypothetical protein [Candidatus Bathyarchaeia archaeon]